MSADATVETSLLPRRVPAAAVPPSADSPAALASSPRPERAAKLLMEVAGTATLVLTVQLAFSVHAADAGAGASAPLAVAAVLVALIHAGGPISGAHYNPAVTASFALRGRVSCAAAAQYVAAELVGAVLGAWAGAAMLPLSTTAALDAAAVPAPPRGFVIAPGQGVGLAAAAAAEVLFTALLCLTILATVSSTRTAGNHYFGVAIAAVVFVAAVAVGPISGAGLNPAVVIGLAAAREGPGAGVAYTAVAVISEMVGGALGAVAFLLVAPDQMKLFNAGARSPLNNIALRL